MGRLSPEDRRRQFEAWIRGLSPEQLAHEIRSGHVRRRLPENEPKAQRRPKRTRAHQERAKQHARERSQHGEAFVHMNPFQKARFLDARA